MTDDERLPAADGTPAEPDMPEPADTHSPPAEPQDPAAPQPDAAAWLRARTRRSLLWAAAAVPAGWFGLRWIGSRRAADGVAWPLRVNLEATDNLARDLYSARRTAPLLPAAAASPDPRVNGDDGLSDDFDPDAWRLSVVDATTTPPGDTVHVTLAEIQQLDHVDMTTELHCIEGWTEVIRWQGARLADFVRRWPPATRSGMAADPAARPGDLPDFIGLETPDRGYYVGIDMPAALHPQTLLCWGINGEPLAMEHGAPLRLVIPVKYGVKNIKRIGRLTYTNTRPADFWAEQGYDWYAGL